MHTLNIELLKKILPKKHLTLTSKSVFEISLNEELLIIKAKGRITTYPLEALYLIAENIIISRSIAAPVFWSEYTESKRDYYYLRVRAIDCLSVTNYMEINFINYNIIETCNNPPIFLYESIDGESHEQKIRLLSNQGIVYNYMPKEIDDEAVQIIPINYATTRKETFDDLCFDQHRDSKINYGVVHVSIPKKAHRPGNIETPYVFGIRLSKEDHQKHFILHSRSILSEEVFLRVLSKTDDSDKIVVFIHGFNVSFKEAAFKAAQIKYDIKIKHSMLLISWPSFSKTKDYAYDKQSTITSALMFSKLFDTLETNELFKGKEIVVIAHSMGNMLLSQIVSHMKNPCLRFTNAALAAADVTQFEFKDIFISYFKNVFKQVSIYVNQNDKALLVSKIVNKSPLVGDSSQQVCIHPEIETIDTTGFDGKILELYHSYFASEVTVLNDIRYFLIESLPANKRALKMKD